jgi:hypothetical protein
MNKIKLPRFPPRKARNTPTLTNFVVRWLDKFQILLNLIPSSSPFNMKDRLKLLLLTAIDRTSISRKARDLREQTPKRKMDVHYVLRFIYSNRIINFL